MTRPRQRVAVYGYGIDDDGRVLATRAAASLTVAGRWFLPGGGVSHGESPEDALRRECEEETGLTVTLGRLLGVLSDMTELPDGTPLHTIRVIYAIDSWDGDLRAEISGSSDAVEWVPRDELLSREIMPYVRRVLDELT